MGFVLKKKPSFMVTVGVDIPNDGGGFDHSKFRCKFKQITTDEIEEIKDWNSSDVVRKVLIGWEDLFDEEKNSVEYNEENLESLIQIPQAVGAVHLAFWKGLAKAPAKN